MGNAANLFCSTGTNKETLHQRITPSTEQREEQKDRWNELADYLCPWLKERTGFNVRSWIQGSYKFGTQIRPARVGEEFDIDLGIYLEWLGEPQNTMLATELKHYVLDAVKAFALEANGVKEVTSPSKERCERICYEGDFHIDVPSYHLEPNKDRRSLATETKGWEQSDPKAMVVWFREKAGNDDDRAQIRRVVRYLKMWSALKFNLTDRPSSILLTVLATEAYQTIANSLCDDDEILNALVIAITNRLQNDRSVPNPVDPTENLNRLNTAQTDNFLDKLKILQNVSERALAAGTTFEASVIWSEAFEHFFPIPDDKELLEQANTNGFYALVPIRLIDIAIVATPSNGNGQTYHGTNRIGPIPKNYDIKFTVISDLPLLADVEWMVRNTGVEAGDVNDLGHRADTGRTAKEHSAYNGTHYMDCLARENGRLVGYRRIPVTVNNGAARNRPRPKRIQFRSTKR